MWAARGAGQGVRMQRRGNSSAGREGSPHCGAAGDQAGGSLAPNGSELELDWRLVELERAGQNRAPTILAKIG
jgi:hypothetical protein